MKLQLALDFISKQEAKELLLEVEQHIDIIEIGTPFVIMEGAAIISQMKGQFPSLELLADFKIMDAGEQEARIGFEAGADIVTVLGVAHDATIDGAVQEAQRFQKSIMVDMIGCQNLEERAIQVEKLGVDYLCVHTAFDIQGQGRHPFKELEQIKSVLKTAKIAVAGGIKLGNVINVINQQPEIVIVGGGITGQDNPQETARKIKELLDRRPEK